MRSAILTIAYSKSTFFDLMARAFPAVEILFFSNRHLKSFSPQMPLEDIQIIYTGFACLGIRKGSGKVLKAVV